MNNKTKNNILIIAVVTLSALTVLALVLITGFSKNSRGEGNSSSIVYDPSDTSEPADTSEPISEPADSTDTESGDSSSVPSPDDTGARIAASASALIGEPFEENGSEPGGFDNSGFIYYVLRENGYISCPRTTEGQADMGTHVGLDELRAGDLAFFGNDGSGEADFGGVYIGNGKMIACLMPGTTVKEIDITTEYYVSNFFGGVSLF